MVMANVSISDSEAACTTADYCIADGAVASIADGRMTVADTSMSASVVRAATWGGSVKRALSALCELTYSLRFIRPVPPTPDSQDASRMACCATG